MVYLQFILRTLADESAHFTLAFCLGLLAFWSISTIYYAIFSIVRRWMSSRECMVAGYGILICPLLLAFSLALLSHWALDYWSVLYHTPLGPHLILE